MLVTLIDLQTRCACLSALAKLVNTRYQYFLNFPVTSFYYCMWMTHRPNAVTRTWKYRVLPGVVRHAFIIFGLFTMPNLCSPWHKILAMPLYVFDTTHWIFIAKYFGAGPNYTCHKMLGAVQWTAPIIIDFVISVWPRLVFTTNNGFFPQILWIASRQSGL